VYSGCVKVIDCFGVKDKSLIVDKMTADRHAALHQHVCSGNVREGSSHTAISIQCVESITFRVYCN